MKLILVLCLVVICFQTTVRESNTGFELESKYDACEIVEGGYIRYYLGWWVYKTVASVIIYKCDVTELVTNVKLYVTAATEFQFKDNLVKVLDQQQNGNFILPRDQRDYVKGMFDNIHDAFWSGQELTLAHKTGKLFVYARGDEIGNSDKVTMQSTQTIIDLLKAFGDYQKTIN